jgi:hypothetical protein
MTRLLVSESVMPVQSLPPRNCSFSLNSPRILVLLLLSPSAIFFVGEVRHEVEHEILVVHRGRADVFLEPHEHGR